MTLSDQPSLRAVADLHVGHRGNSGTLDRIVPAHPGDWLIVAGDIGERLSDVHSTLAILTERFERVVYTPGNHELWGSSSDPETTGPERYARIVEICRELGVDSPEDPYPLWTGPGGPAWVVPMFLLYDYSWTMRPGQSASDAVREARARRVVASDEFLIDPAPFSDSAAWCGDRLVQTTRRLSALDPAYPTVLVNHWPLLRDPTRVLFAPEFALWCGTEQTAQWHLRYRALACVYGHLHIPRSQVIDGVRFEECSLGYPREWTRRGHPEPLARQILPAPDVPGVRWLRDPDGGLHIAAPGEEGDEVTSIP